MPRQAEEGGGGRTREEGRSVEEQSSRVRVIEGRTIQAMGRMLPGTAIGRWPPGTALGAVIGLAAAVAGWRDREESVAS